MKLSESAATDVLSSLPVIACCIVAVMILLGVFANTMAGRSDSSKGGALDEECQRVLSSALRILTSESEDGRKYLVHDWETRLSSLGLDSDNEPDMSASIEVRLFRFASYEFPAAGNISACREVRSVSEPVILIDSGCLIPGEIIVRVGY